MARLAAFVVLALAAAPSALAGAACAAKGHATPEDCVAACGSRWGWPGVAMGTDRWGSVLKPSTQNMTEILHAACGLTSSVAAPSSTAPVAAGSAPPSASVTLATSHPATLASSSSVKPTTSTQSNSSVHSSSSTPLSTSSAPSFIESTHSATSVSFTPKSSSTSTPPATTSSTHHTTSTPPPPPPPPKTSTTHTSAAATSSSDNSGSSGSGGGNGGNGGGSSSGGGVTSSNDISQYLQFHNTIRAQHGAAALSWNQTLANIAQTWANKCVFKHSGGTLGPFGENLAAGTGSSYGIEAAIQSWTNEVSQYNPSDPVASHFTQVVWKASSQVGCALAECAGGTIFPSSFGTSQYYVCEYHTQGNVIGQFAQNVQV